MVLASLAALALSLEDRNEFCAEWAARGECQTQSAYMLHNCPRSCRSRSSHSSTGQVQQQSWPHGGSSHLSNSSDNSTVATADTTLPQRSSVGEESMVSSTRTGTGSESGPLPSCTETADALERCREERSRLEATVAELTPTSADPEQHYYQRSEAMHERAKNAEKQLRSCMSRAKEAASDRMKLVRDMQEKEDAHTQKLNLALKRQARQAQKREWQQLEAMRFVERRAAAAEVRLAGIVTGSERQAAEKRASVLAEELSAAEQARKTLEESHRRLMEEASDRENQLRNALLVAETRNKEVQAKLEAAIKRGQKIEAQLVSCTEQIHASQVSPCTNSTLSIGSQRYSSPSLLSCPRTSRESGCPCNDDCTLSSVSQQRPGSPESSRGNWIRQAWFAESFSSLRHRFLSWLHHVV